MPQQQDYTYRRCDPQTPKYRHSVRPDGNNPENGLEEHQNN